MATSIERARRAMKIAAWVVFAALALPALAYFVPATVGDDVAYVVLSGSMEPGYSPGDVVFVEHVEPRTLAVGDVVTFRVNTGMIVTHRIIEALPQEEGRVAFRTQGDANEDADPFLVTEGMVIGKVEKTMPLWGHVVMTMRSKQGILLFVMLPCAILLAREMARIYKLLAAAKAHAPPTGES